MFALFYTFLYINDVKKRIHVQYWQNRKDRVSEYICVNLCERAFIFVCSERAIFGGFNSFTVKKVHVYLNYNNFCIALYFSLRAIILHVFI